MSNWLAILVYGVLLALLYHPAVVYLMKLWRKEDFNYGYIILPVVLYLVWEKRSQLKRLISIPSWMGLIPVAFALGWQLGSPPLETLRLDLIDALWGVAAALPPAGLLWLAVKWRPRWLDAMARLLDETIVPLFRDCRLTTLAGICVLAGLGEEMFFRGVIQSAAAVEIGPPHGDWIALAMSAALFGLMHPLTPAYALLAGLMGFYLGAIWLAGGNLLIPITAHGLYDFLALAYLTRSGRCEMPVQRA